MTRWIGAAWVVGVALACAHAGEAGDGEHVIYRARAFGHTIGSYRERIVSRPSGRALVATWELSIAAPRRLRVAERIELPLAIAASSPRAIDSESDDRRPLAPPAVRDLLRRATRENAPRLRFVARGWLDPSPDARTSVLRRTSGDSTHGEATWTTSSGDELRLDADGEVLSFTATIGGVRVLFKRVDAPAVEPIAAATLPASLRVLARGPTPRASRVKLRDGEAVTCRLRLSPALAALVATDAFQTRDAIDEHIIAITAAGPDATRSVPRAAAFAAPGAPAPTTEQDATVAPRVALPQATRTALAPFVARALARAGSDTLRERVRVLRAAVAARLDRPTRPERRARSDSVLTIFEQRRGDCLDTARLFQAACVVAELECRVDIGLVCDDGAWLTHAWNTARDPSDPDDHPLWHHVDASLPLTPRLRYLRFLSRPDSHSARYAPELAAFLDAAHGGCIETLPPPGREPVARSRRRKEPLMNADQR